MTLTEATHRHNTLESITDKLDEVLTDLKELDDVGFAADIIHEQFQYLCRKMEAAQAEYERLNEQDKREFEAETARMRVAYQHEVFDFDRFNR